MGAVEIRGSMARPKTQQHPAKNPRDTH